MKSRVIHAKRASQPKAELRDFSSHLKGRPLIRELYLRAKAQLRKQRKSLKSGNGAPKSEADTQRLLHELQVHQIELEMQNVELEEARNRVEALLAKYTDLYDFAPVGYMSLDEQGRILELNLAGAALLGIRRSQILNRHLPVFVAPAS